MTDPIAPKSIRFENEQRPDGSSSRTFSIDTADIALVLVTILLLVFFVMALAVEDLRDELSGVVTALIGVMTLAVGGLAAFKVFRGQSG